MATPAPRAWAALLAARPDLAQEPLVAGWAQAGYPLVARRLACGDAAGMVPLGLPLPPAQGKRRIALGLEPGDIIRSAPPPLLRDAAAAAPAAWRASIEAFVSLDAHTRCFGSLAWQHLTGLDYIGEGSDLDLLWDLPAAGGLECLIEDIAAIERGAPMRIDGEVRGRLGDVNWRELQAGCDVLVKGQADARLMPRADFLVGGGP